MSEKILIRPLVAADRDAWQPLWDGYNEFYERVGPTALAADISDLTWRRFLDAGEPVHAMLAEIDGQVVGLVHYLYHRSTTMRNDICYLQDLFTLPEARGHGVGRALIEAVYEAARAAGSTRVYWQTREDNATARALYDTMAEPGFVVYRRDL